MPVRGVVSSVHEWMRKASERGMHSMVITLLESLIGGTDVVFPKYG